MPSASSASGSTSCPPAVAELAGLGLLDALDAVAVRTGTLIMTTRRGQPILARPAGPRRRRCRFRSSRSTAATCNGSSLDALRDRAGTDVRARRSPPRPLRTGRPRCAGATSSTAPGRRRRGVDGDVLIGADGIHSTVRAQLVPDEGEPAVERVDAVARGDGVAGVPRRPDDDRRRGQRRPSSSCTRSDRAGRR